MNGHDYEYEYEYSAPFGAPGFYACNLLLSARRVAASDTDTTYSVAENFTCVFRWSNVGDVDSTWSSRITAVVEKGGVNRYAPDSLNDPIKRVPFFRYNAIDTAELRAFEYGGRMWVSKSDRGEVRLDGGYGPGGYRALYVRGIGLVDWYDHHKNGYNTGGGGWRSYRLRKFDGVIIDSDSLVAISDSR